MRKVGASFIELIHFLSAIHQNILLTDDYELKVLFRNEFFDTTYHCQGMIVWEPFIYYFFDFEKL
jgi:hypothetical protein